MVACAYTGYIAPEVLAALPEGVSHNRFVGELRNGEFVTLYSGAPEAALKKLIQ